MPQPLAGIRVADFSHVMAGPFASHFLRLLGAEVVKIESQRGDAMRTYGPFREHDGLSPAFIAANVGKQSLAVDLKAAAGIEIAKRLIARSDVVLENFRPGVMQRLGLDYESCKSLRPELIYCAISGYGQNGRRRDHTAIDNIVQATSGIMASNGDADEPPSRVGWPVVDTYTGTLAAMAIMAALLQRERFGSGQYIDLAMLDASVVLLTSLATPYLVTGQLLPRTGDVGYSGSPTSATFLTADGTRVSLGVVQNNHFALLCQLLGRPDLVDDPRFRDPVARATPANVQPLRQILTRIFLTRPGALWEQELSSAGVPCGLVRDIGQVCELARQDGRELILPCLAQPNGTHEPAAFVNAGFLFEHDGPGAVASAPRLGEHTSSVLQELGYTPGQIERLMREGVVHGEPPAAGSPESGMDSPQIGK